MSNIQAALKSEENHHYKTLESIRLHGIPMKQIADEFKQLIKPYTSNRVPVINQYHNDKMLNILVDDKYISPRLVLMLLESMDVNIHNTKENPSFDEVLIMGSIGIYRLEVAVMVKHNQNCYYVETGSKIVPTYELRCEEDE